ncbi:hypothetical protein RRF57_001707 [Xylaria bambusicola]|uniref:Uncharacterized protein n=1 Tax=Xylaria bambusicola TaxID=326684 RepID=A0AAN7UIU4_9PEZI
MPRQTQDFGQRVSAARQALMSIRIEMEGFIQDIGGATSKPKQIADTAAVQLGLLDWVESSRSVRRMADIEWAIVELNNQIANKRGDWVRLRARLRR